MFAPDKILPLGKLFYLPYTLQGEIRQGMHQGASPGELVEVPDEYKGLVIGKGGDNLGRISTLTGVKVIRKGGEVYVTGGTREQREQAKVHIKVKIVSRSNEIYFLSLPGRITQSALASFCLLLLLIDSLLLCMHTYTYNLFHVLSCKLQLPCCI